MTNTICIYVNKLLQYLLYKICYVPLSYIKMKSIFIKYKTNMYLNFLLLRVLLRRNTWRHVYTRDRIDDDNRTCNM